MQNCAHLFQAKISTGDSSLVKAKRDPLIYGATNEGIRFIADLGFGYCYPGGALSGRPAASAPANAAVVYDASDTANGIVRVAAGDSVAYAGGGFNFGTVTKQGNYLEIPESVAADIYTVYGGNSQQFMVCAYIKMPSSANWNTNASLATMLQFAGAGTATYQNTSDLVLLAQGTGGTLQARRQTAAGTITATSITMGAGDYGLITQVAFWRNASGVGLRIKNSNGTQVVTGVAGSNNTQDFSAKTGQVGVSGGFWAVDGNQTLIGSGQTAAKNFRLYRVFVENLARSGRDPVTVLDADYERVIARNAFS